MQEIFILLIFPIEPRLCCLSSVILRYDLTLNDKLKFILMNVFGRRLSNICEEFQFINPNSLRAAGFNNGSVCNATIRSTSVL